LAQDCGTPPDSSKSVAMKIRVHVFVWIVRNHIDVPLDETFQVPCASAANAVGAGQPSIPAGVSIPANATPP